MNHRRNYSPWVKNWWTHQIRRLTHQLEESLDEELALLEALDDDLDEMPMASTAVPTASSQAGGTGEVFIGLYMFFFFYGFYMILYVFLKVYIGVYR